MEIVQINEKKQIVDKVRFGGIFNIVCRDKNGNIKWEDTAKNLVTNVGLQHILDVVFSGGTAVGTWYVGLTDGTPTVAAGDTLASHTGWVEVTAYADNRKAYVEVRSSQTLTNTASKASFAINADSTTIGGAFLCSVATTTTGTLMCAAAFTGGDKAADDGDTLDVTYTFTAGDDGA